MRRMIPLSLAILALGLATPAMAARESKKPNILIFLSDDVGWAEYGFQGAKDIPTPNIDSIAKGGVRFPQGYVSGPYCSPTRAGLMTGKYQTRFGHEFNSISAPGGPGLSGDEKTFADRFKALGYATSAIGKWHLGFPEGKRPTDRGFDEFLGTLGNTSYFNATNFVDSRKPEAPRKVDDASYYTTDAYADRAAEFVKAKKDQPWFLYVPFNAQHAPLQAPQKYLDRFPDIENANRKMFAAVMSAMDDAVGKVLATVRETGQEENTLIVFFSDNGGPTGQTTSNNKPLRGFKATTWEGGVRVPFCLQWKGTIPAGQTFDRPIIQLDLLPTALAAAGVSPDPSWKLDGVNLLPYLTGKNDGKPHSSLYWRFGDQWAVRHGDFKLVVGRDGSGKPELYNLADDIAESKDLAAAQPEKLKELQDLYNTWNAEQSDPKLPKEAPAAKKKANNKKKAAKKKS